jgi:hypothetical protein
MSITYESGRTSRRREPRPVGLAAKDKRDTPWPFAPRGPVHAAEDHDRYRGEPAALG